MTNTAQEIADIRYLRALIRQDRELSKRYKRARFDFATGRQYEQRAAALERILERIEPTRKPV